MKIEISPTDNSAKPITYPILMIGRNGCIKLFTNPTDGIRLRGDSTSATPTDHDVELTADGRARGEFGRPIPATDPYWRTFKGVVALSNDD